MQTVELPFRQPLNINLSERAVLSDAMTAYYNAYINNEERIVKRPGLSKWLDLGETEAVNGLYWWQKKSKLIAVCNGKIFDVDYSAPSKTDAGGERHSIKTQIKFAESHDSQKIISADGGTMICWDGAAAPEYINNANGYGSPPTNVSHIACIDRYIIANNNDGYFYSSDLANVGNWDANMKAQAEQASDDIIALHVISDEVLLLGNQSLEWWYDTGQAGFPFSPTGHFLNRGIGARYAAAEANNTLYFLDNERYFGYLQGKNFTIVSWPINNALQSIDDISDAFCLHLNMGNAAFILLSFPTAQKSYLYDYIHNRWYQVGTWASTEQAWNRFIANTHSFIKTDHLHVIGSTETTGQLYLMARDNYADGDNILRVLLQTGHVEHNSAFKKHSNRLRLFFKRGIPNANEDNPRFAIRWKDDYGQWGDWILKSLGQTGEYFYEVTLQPMGQYYTRQYQLQFTDKTELIFIKALEEFEVIDA